MKTGDFIAIKRCLMAVSLMAICTITAAAQYETKKLQIRVRDSAQVTIQPITQPVDKAFHVSLTPLQPHYEVNESIRFNVNSNRPFYMYIFSLDYDANEAILILPHRLQQGNKYPANQSMLVPNADVEFFANRAGQEKLVMIASEHYFDWDTSGYTEASVFLKTSLKQVTKQLKKLNVRPTGASNFEPVTPDDIVIKEISIDVVDTNPVIDPVVLQVEQIFMESASTDGMQSLMTPTPRPQSTVLNNTIVTTERLNEPSTPTHLNTFVHTNKRHYNIGESVKIMYGTNRAGWLHLMSYDGEHIIAQSSSRVKADSVQELNAMASLPAGLTQIAAIYTPTSARPSKDNIKAIFHPTNAKGLINHRVDHLVFSKAHFYVSE